MNTETKTETAGYAVVKKVYEGEIDFSEVVSHCRGDNAELIRWHLGLSVQMGRMSLAHAIFAGWLLERQKTQLGYGKWESWCKTELGFSKDTADRYIALYKKTVGAARTPAGIGSGQVVGAEELDAATEAVDASTATGAMIELGIIKRAKDCGGDRRKQAAKNGKVVGRPPKNLAKEVEEAAKDPDLSWAEVKDYLNDLREFGIENDGFGNLADDDLETVVVKLAELSRRAGDILAARKKGTSAIKQANMPVEEVVGVIERGL